MTHVNSPNLFQSTPQPSRPYGYRKMQGKLVQQAHWANEIAVEEHEHVVIKLASDSDSSSDTDTIVGLRAYKFSLYWSNQSSYSIRTKNTIFVPPTYRCYMWNIKRIVRRSCLKMLTDRRRMPTYTISSPMSLRLRWAKKTEERLKERYIKTKIKHS